VADSNGSYDIVILGGGSGGYACALRAAELGKRVALIEKDKVGGTCLHRGCIPTKALLHAAEVADQAREGEAFGVRSTFEGIDMPGVNAYKDKVVDRLWKGLQSTLASRKIDIVYGDGTLVSPTQVRVGDTIYEGAHVVLATGSEAKSLPGLEIDGERVINRMTLARLPVCGGLRASSAAGLPGWTSQACGARSVPRSPSSRCCRTWCRWKTRPAPSCWSGRSGAAASATNSVPGSRGSRTTAAA
jgi:hypothetical protein